jgi:excisionase family DNA binding protein
MNMKSRPTQFGVRRNPDSQRVHGLRLAVNSLPGNQSAQLQNRKKQMPSTTSGHHSLDTSDSSAIGYTIGATGEERQGTGPLLTVEEVASLLHVSVSWVYGRIRKRSLDRLPGYRLGKYWRFREDEIHAWVEDQRGASCSA